MAAFVQDVFTFNTTAGNKTAALTPAVNGLLVVCFGASGTTTVGTITDDQGGTYTTITSFVFNTSAHHGAVAIRNSLVSSAVSHTVTLTQTGDTGGGLFVIEFSGMTRAGGAASRQTAIEQNVSAGGTPLPTFGASALTGNPTIGFVRNNSNTAGLTPPTSWTERRDVGYNTPTSGAELVTRDSGFTGTTITWGSTSATVYGSLILELDTSTPPATDFLAGSSRMMTGVGR